MTALSDASFEVFQLLTQRTLLVLDTEYCRDPEGNGHRLISLAIVPVVRGNRVRADVLYRVMNPGVPIDAGSRAVHGFTDDAVKRKRRFGTHAAAILDALRVPDAVLVMHTGVDLRVLRAELERLDAARVDGQTGPGMADLPDLPIIDTSTLPRLLQLPGINARGAVSLATLNALTGTSNSRPHDARGDAAAAADALLNLLQYAASKGLYTSLDALLADHDRGTTLAPKLPMFVRGRRPSHPPVSPEHLAAHTEPLTHAGTAAERARWLERALQCAQLRCPHLRAEAKLAAEHNGQALIDGVAALLPRLTEPGQGGTLAGALLGLLDVADSGLSPSMAETRALRWWAKRRPLVQATPACGDAGSCPDCSEGQPCPRDVMYQSIARIAVYGGRTNITRQDVHDRLFRSEKHGGRVYKWARFHPEVAGWMAGHLATLRGTDGKPILNLRDVLTAIELGLAPHEPRLALVACELIAAAKGVDPALGLARECLASRTTDPAYTDLHAWLVGYEQASGARRREAKRPVITHPRLARPAGRVNDNPYAV